MHSPVTTLLAGARGALPALRTTCALLSAAALAACASRGGDAAPAPSAAEKAADLPPVSAEGAARLPADVAWLADDAREGRRAGTGGERVAASWIAVRLTALGLEPAGTEGFFQAFPVPLAARDGGGSSLAWSRGSAASVSAGAEELAPLFCSAGASFKGALVFCGYGIADPALGRDDFGTYDGARKVAVIVRGVPPYKPAEANGPGALGFPADLEEVPDTWGAAGSIFLKVMNAKRRGFGAVLLVQHPDDNSGVPPFDPGQAAEAGIPALALSAELAERVFPDGYAERVRAADAEALVAAPVELGPVAEVTADVVRAESIATNVLGLLPGRDPGRVVVVGAHFDHLGFGGPGSLAPETLNAVHNGADDNASGTAVGLELAAEAARGPQPEASLLFALWSGEELGLLGSEHWASHPTLPLEDVVANLNLDMVGRAGDGELIVLGAGSSPAFPAWMEPAGRAAGLELEVSLSGQGLGGSDHQVFLRRGIPALHLFSGVHADYHKPSDDAERFEAEGAARVARLAADLTERMAGAGELPFVEPEVEEGAAPGLRERSWSVWFGSVPSYGSDVEGFLLEGTSAGSPAEKAGLLKGDVIVQIGDIKIGGMSDFLYMLQVYKPGDVVLTRFLRDGKPEEVRVTLATRAAE
jgi:hypothetical protein